MVLSLWSAGKTKTKHWKLGTTANCSCRRSDAAAARANGRGNVCNHKLKIKSTTVSCASRCTRKVLVYISRGHVSMQINICRPWFYCILFSFGDWRQTMKLPSTRRPVSRYLVENWMARWIFTHAYQWNTRATQRRSPWRSHIINKWLNYLLFVGFYLHFWCVRRASSSLSATSRARWIFLSWFETNVTNNSDNRYKFCWFSFKFHASNGFVCFFSAQRASSEWSVWKLQAQSLSANWLRCVRAHAE